MTWTEVKEAYLAKAWLMWVVKGRADRLVQVEDPPCVLEGAIRMTGPGLPEAGYDTNEWSYLGARVQDCSALTPVKPWRPRCNLRCVREDLHAYPEELRLATAEELLRL